MTPADIDLLPRILGLRSGRMCDFLSRLVIPEVEEYRKLVKKRTSEIIGKTVVDAYGPVLGSAVDVELDIDNTLFSLIVSNHDSPAALS